MDSNLRKHIFYLKPSEYDAFYLQRILMEGDCDMPQQA